MKAHARRCEACGAMFLASDHVGANNSDRWWRCAECNARPKPATDTVGQNMIQRDIPGRAMAEMARGGRR